MSRIKVLHLITTLDTGGAERTLHRLVAGMDRDAFDNSVVSLVSGGAIAPVIRDAGVPVESLGMRLGVPSPGGLVRLRRILKRDRPAILQTWMYHADLLGLVASRIAPVPRLIWNIRCSEMDTRGYSLLSRATRRMLAMTSRIPDAVVVNSRAGIAVHERYGYVPRRWELIPNGVDANAFERDERGARSLRKELHLSEEVPVVGTLGRFDEIKDYPTFLRGAAEARKRFPALRVLMAGRGLDAANPQLARIIADAGLDGAVDLLGERRDVVRVLSALDVFCLSSIGEGFPNVIAEAMACEVPVVATDAGDSAWITDTSAVPAGDAAALAGALIEVLDMPAEARRARGIAHRRRIEQDFGLERMIAKYESLYRDLAT